MSNQRQQAVPPARSKVTIVEVAARAGVSTATVSRVLSGLSGARSPAREGVLKVARELNFHPNRLARGLRGRQRKLIGLILPDLQNPFFTGVVHGVEGVLCEAGFTLLLGHSNGLAEREQTHLGVLRGEGASGLVLIPGNAPDSDYESLRAWHLPVVAVDRTPTGLEVDFVSVTNRDGAREATQHFVALGYREIALINGPKGFDVSRERLIGYQEALNAAALPHTASLAVNGDFQQRSGYERMGQLLDLSKRPRAVLVGNNLMTLGALQAIHERGLRIPEDVAVIGFDDMAWATSLRPPLSAVAQPAEELGRTAARLLLEKIAEPDRPARQVVLKTRLVVRASCGAAGQQP